MAQQKKGFITRMLEGKEKSEEYARGTLPTNRWQLFWDIFKGNFGKLVKVNLLTILFFVPLFAVIILYNTFIDGLGGIYPFSAGIAPGGAGVIMANLSQKGLAEMLSLQNGLILYLGIMITSIIAAVGMSGGMYVVRNMVWTEGVFVANDFWRGIKLNFKNALQTAIFFTLVLTLCNTMINFADFTLKVGTTSKWQEVFLNISKGVSYVFIVFAMLVSFWMIALGVNYKFKFFAMFRNAFLMTVGTIFQSIFFGALAILPFALLFVNSTIIMITGVIIVLLFGLSYALLLWLDFAQWVFDKYINPKLSGAKVGRGIYNKDGTSTLTGDDSATSIEYQRMILAHGKSRLVARPIKPIDDSLQVYELPTSFSRDDLKRLKESKQNIMEDTENYAEEHKNDLRYVEYNKQFEEREKALADALDKKGKKKRKPPKMLGD